MVREDQGELLPLMQRSNLEALNCVASLAMFRSQFVYTVHTFQTADMYVRRKCLGSMVVQIFLDHSTN